MKKILLFLLLLNIKAHQVFCQDPAFSQFFSSPLNINPALTANINADWRVISNLRNQWINPANPYMTGTISFDRKIMQNKMPGVDEGNVWGIGGMFMYDHSFDGIQKSIYGSANLSYRMKLMENEVTTHRLGLGFGAIYGRRFINFGRLDFEEQFVGNGFNTNLPTGEVALENMKPYLSSSAGLTYSITSEKSNFDLGVSAFHINKPRQTFLKDENQVLPVRHVIHANYERYLNERVVLNVNTIYQFQKEATYYSIGGALGYYVGGQQDVLLNGGIWYWSDNAVIPYFGILYKDMQFGFSYDITTSKLNEAPKRPNTFELAFIFRGVKDPTGIIPCPWK
jgi:type IX secretion system PorP/SprF family membrane protein